MKMTYNNNIGLNSETYQFWIGQRNNLEYLMINLKSPEIESFSLFDNQCKHHDRG